MRLSTIIGPRAATLVGLAVASVACDPIAPPQSQFSAASDALGQMKAQYECANGVKGQGKLDHYGQQGRVRGEVLLFAINPARVRIDVISPFGAMIYSLTSNGETFKMLDTQEKRFLTGPASACNLARLTQVPVPGHVLVSLLRGEAPLLVHQPEAASIDWDGERGWYQVSIPSTRDASQEIFLEVHPDDFDKPSDQQRLRVRGVNVFQRGATVYEAAMDDHALFHTAPPRVDEDGLEPDIPPSGGPCDVEVPQEIRIQVPSTTDDVVFTYEEGEGDEAPVAFNPPIPEGAFDQPDPPGVTKQFVDCRDE